MHMRKIIGAMAAAMLLAALLAVPAMAGNAEHCPGANEGNAPDVPDDLQIVEKVEANHDTELNGHSELPGTLVCVFGGADSTGIVDADGQTMKYLLEQYDIRNKGGNIPDVSYYIVYGNGNGGNGEEPNGEEAPEEEAPEEVTEETPEEEEAPEEEEEEAPEEGVLAEGQEAPQEEAPQEVAPREVERIQELAHTGISAWVLALIATGMLAIGGTLVSRSNRA